jgi:hypothetical protein
VVRWWTYVLSIAAIPVILVGTVVFVFAGAEAYMVTLGGAQPGDAIYLDTLAPPLWDSLLDMTVGVGLIGVGLWTRVFARSRRRAAS